MSSITILPATSRDFTPIGNFSLSTILYTVYRLLPIIFAYFATLTCIFRYTHLTQIKKTLTILATNVSYCYTCSTIKKNKFMSNEELAKRDYVIAIDRSGSMGTAHKGGKTRFQYAQEQTEALARKCAEFDADGIDVLFFNNTVKAFNNVTPDKVTQVFKESQPSGGTATDLVLKEVFDGYFNRKKAGSAKPVTLLVITDGEPNDAGAVTRVIIEASKNIDADEELAVTFIQAGDDPGARKFLESLDNDLQSKGAKFDIVDTKNESEMDNLSLEEILAEAING